MKTTIALVALLAAACSPMSERHDDAAAGANGGFEAVRDGLPVNWQVYTPATVPSASFRIEVDRADRVEGAQSLRFDVDRCEATGGWRSPGLSREFDVPPGSRVAVEFAVKNLGCDWTVAYGGVDATAAAYDHVGSADVPAGDWQTVRREVQLPQEFDRLRFELSITAPGRLWIDDVRVAIVEGGP